MVSLAGAFNQLDKYASSPDKRTRHFFPYNDQTIASMINLTSENIFIWELVDHGASWLFRLLHLARLVQKQ